MCALAPHVVLDVRLSYVLTFLLVSAVIVVVSRFVAVESPRVLVGLVLVALGLLFTQRGAPVSVFGGAVVGFALLAGASALGAALGARIERPGHLLAVAAISAVADLWSVYDPAGLSAQMAESVVEEPHVMSLFAVPWPLLGTADVPPIIGAGDIVFTALYLAAFERHGLALRRAAWALFVAYALGLAVIMGTERPVPLLPLLGAAVLAVDPQARSLPAHERRTVWLMLAGLGVVLAVRFLR